MPSPTLWNWRGLQRRHGPWSGRAYLLTTFRTHTGMLLFFFKALVLFFVPPYFVPYLTYQFRGSNQGWPEQKVLAESGRHRSSLALQILLAGEESHWTKRRGKIGSGPCGGCQIVPSKDAIRPVWVYSLAGVWPDGANQCGCSRRHGLLAPSGRLWGRHPLKASTGGEIVH